MQAADLVAYVDVDDTLVRSSGTKRIPMTAVVDHVRGLHRSGVTLYCWSAGGADYARRSAHELGIADVFAGFLPKPHLLVDDQPPSEWPNFVVARPAGLASMTVEDHISALAHRGRANKTYGRPPVSNADHLHPRRVAAYVRIREELRRWDPIGVICESNQDEYDSYAQEFASRLDAQMPVDKIVEFMRQLVTEHMGLPSFNEARALACATELAVFWRSWKDG